MSDELKEATEDRAKAFLRGGGIYSEHDYAMRMKESLLFATNFANAETAELRRVLGELVEALDPFTGDPDTAEHDVDAAVETAKALLQK